LGRTLVAWKSKEQRKVWEKTEHGRKAVRRAQYLTRYKITVEQYLKMEESQRGLCAICLQPPSGKRNQLFIDHDHKTGFVRGLLCNLCNSGIGKLGDTVDRLQRAIDYLKAARPGREA
jgi:hypothetical protein